MVLQIELVVLALVTAGLVLAAILWVERRERRAPISVFAEDTTATVFLFDGEVLIDSTPGARALLAAIPAQPTPWTQLMAWATPHFPELEGRLLRLPLDGTLNLTANDKGKPLVLQAELRGGLTRITITDPSHARAGHDMMALRAMEEEVSLLRDAAAKSPTLVWKEGAAGEVIWANSAYMLKASEVLANKDLAWPLPRIFTEAGTTKGENADRPGALRHRLTLPGGKDAWYDVLSIPEGEEKLHFATAIGGQVQVETALRDFMVTLTKTFAHLHVGLAIFDSQRQLVLFNPAIMDLTGLPADFLTMRPSLVAVLDGMRERNMIPEPKDYRGWRRQLTEMERAAASGLYEDTWSLPGGQTYRVIGRPHPNGAIALMIEDISSEMIRTRRFRADLEIGQSVLDHLDEAIAVFSPSGQLVTSNAAYAELWGESPNGNLSEATLRSLSMIWRNRCAPSPVWSDLEDFAAETGAREAWNAELRLNDGRVLEARFVPLVGGATMTGYRLRDAAAAPKTIYVKAEDRKTA